MKNSKTLRIIKTFFLIAFFCYLLNAFYFWNFNPALWTERFPFVLVTGALSIIINLVNEIE